MSVDFLIVGAGVAGLACARELAKAGAAVGVLERSRGVGGRCATRRVGERVVDHGLSFFHGHTAEFREAVEKVDANIRVGWPFEIEGSGVPCQPAAFASTSWRLAFEGGVNTFPRHLAEGLAIEQGAAAALVAESDGWMIHGQTGSWRGGTVVLALPTGQALPLLAGLPDEPEIRGARALLGMLGSHPCIAVLAGYPADAPVPKWDVAYPESSAVLQLAAHDSAKRTDPPGLVMVYQALPCWSRLHLAADDATCTRGILDAAAALWGAWAGRPDWAQVHRWELARADAGMELVQPMVLRLASGLRLGLCGEVFSPGGGIEAAWHSGRELARRLIDEMNS